MIGGECKAALNFIWFMRVHPVIKAAPLCIARIQFFVGQFARFRPAPCLGGKSFQRARPAALGIFVAVGMQTGKEIRNR